MMKTTRLFLLIEAVAFAAVSYIHSGLLLAGFADPPARIAEGVISFVLFAGLALTWIRPTWTRSVGLGAQGFALLGTLVGIVAITLVPGPRRLADIVFHIAMVALLGWGYALTRRTPLDETRQPFNILSTNERIDG
jgi:hypothetical protein